MQIIKISPVSFKIILSKEDLKRGGVENILENTSLLGEFFTELIERTNSLYGSPFVSGAVDAEFFEAKDGGGELFLTKSKNACKNTICLFTTKNSDDLFNLSLRLSTLSLHEDSELYCQDDLYNLVIYCKNKCGLLISLLKEYGNASEISKFKLWVIKEHSKKLLSGDAVKKLSSFT